MKHITLFVWLSFQSFFSLAQSDTAFFKIIIPKLSISSIINPITPTVEPGFEIRFAKSFSYDFALGIQAGKNNTDNFLNQRYTKYKNEMRYYPMTLQSKKAMPFIGLEYLNFTRTYSKQSSTFYVDDHTVAYSSADVTRKINAISIVVGSQFLFLKKFTIDVFTGMGLRSRNIQYSKISPPGNANDEGGNDTGLIRFHDSDYRAGKFHTVNIPLSIRAGYELPLRRKK